MAAKKGTHTAVVGHAGTTEPRAKKRTSAVKAPPAPLPSDRLLAVLDGLARLGAPAYPPTVETWLRLGEVSHVAPHLALKAAFASQTPRPPARHSDRAEAERPSSRALLEDRKLVERVSLTMTLRKNSTALAILQCHVFLSDDLRGPGPGSDALLIYALRQLRNAEDGPTLFRLAEVSGGLPKQSVPAFRAQLDERAREQRWPAGVLGLQRPRAPTKAGAAKAAKKAAAPPETFVFFAEDVGVPAAQIATLKVASPPTDASPPAEAPLSSTRIEPAPGAAMVSAHCTPDLHGAGGADGNAPRPRDGDHGFAERFRAAFERFDRRNGGTNQVRLFELRQALPDYDAAAFEGHLRALRLARSFTLESSDARHERLPKEVLEAGIEEGGSLMVFVARRDD